MQTLMVNPSSDQEYFSTADLGSSGGIQLVPSTLGGGSGAPAGSPSSGTAPSSARGVADSRRRGGLLRPPRMAAATRSAASRMPWSCGAVGPTDTVARRPTTNRSSPGHRSSPCSRTGYPPTIRAGCSAAMLRSRGSRDASLAVPVASQTASASISSARGCSLPVPRPPFPDRGLCSPDGATDRCQRPSSATVALETTARSQMRRSPRCSAARSAAPTCGVMLPPSRARRQNLRRSDGLLSPERRRCCSPPA
mmetsp:Transcript_32027/g.76124  ORF Transcript_32027/g.76124 Transcript_32027/m.76124 type:complete len:252 (-) Transcript_32027:321-1076(-)